MSPVRSRRIATGLALLLGAGALGAGVPASPVGSQSQNCRTDGQEFSLPPGEHVVPFATTMQASGSPGIGTMEITVGYQGEVSLTVSESRQVTAATADVAVTIDGAVTGVPGLAGDIGGSGAGTLSLGSANHERIQLQGDIDGLGGIGFSGMTNQSFEGTGVEHETLTLHLSLTGGSCSGASGALSSAFVDSSLANMNATGLTATAEPMTWSVGVEPSAEAQAIAEELRAIEQIGTSGPDRRASTSRLSKALTRIKALPDDEQQCLFQSWLHTTRRVLEKRIDADTAVVDSIQPTSADLGPLYGAIATLIESARQYQLLGLDECSEQRPVFDTIGAALGRFLQKAVDDGRMVDMLKLSRDYQLMGNVSPALAAEVDAAVGNEISRWAKTTRTNLEELAADARAAGDTECSAADRQAVHKAIAAQRSLTLWGGEPDPLDHFVELAATLGCAS